MTLYNWKTYRAVAIAWLQAWIGWAWNLPGRFRAWRDVRTGRTSPMDAEVFRARVAASNERIAQRERQRLEAVRSKVRASMPTSLAEYVKTSSPSSEPGGHVPQAVCGVCSSPLYIGARGWECRNDSCDPPNEDA